MASIGHSIASDGKAQANCSVNVSYLHHQNVGGQWTDKYPLVIHKALPICLKTSTYSLLYKVKWSRIFQLTFILVYICMYVYLFVWDIHSFELISLNEKKACFTKQSCSWGHRHFVLVVFENNNKTQQHWGDPFFGFFTVNGPIWLGPDYITELRSWSFPWSVEKVEIERCL